MNKPFLTDNRLSHSTLTDLYQLTMAQNYWKLSKKNLKTVFHLTFRDIPFGNGYICGLVESDLIYLSGVKTGFCFRSGIFLRDNKRIQFFFCQKVRNSFKTSKKHFFLAKLLCKRKKLFPVNLFERKWKKVFD